MGKFICSKVNEWDILDFLGFLVLLVIGFILMDIFLLPPPPRPQRAVRVARRAG
ncbi:hypothetical protein Golax_025349 [Gossypium laxum]|uniref:Uncharacterized protein n=1 Tax=Gossypium laxum TaxID=34288 RepID=A0A7J9AY00_9ROSI|nr:hypothetical protein [Gossypium laxum]